MKKTSQTSAPSWRLGGVLAGVVAVVHLAAAFWVVPALRSAGFAYLEDRDAYLEIAQNLVAGKGYVLSPGPHPTLRRMPAYPFVLAGELALAGGDLKAAALLQIGFAVAATALCFFALRQWGWWAAVLAALGTGLHPLSLIYSHRFFSEILSIFWTAAALFCLSRLGGRRRTAWTVALSAILAAGWLTRTTVSIWLVPLAVLLFCKPPWPGRWRTLALGAAVFLVAVTPWIVRNWSLTGEFVAGSTWNARSLLHGIRNSVDPTFGSQPREVDSAQIRRASEAVSQIIGPIDAPGKEIEEDRLSTAWIQEELVKSPGQRFLAFLKGIPRCLYLTSSKQVRILAGLVDVFLLAAALAGLFFCRLPDPDRARLRWALWLLFLTFWLFHAAFFPLVRYLAPAVPALAALAGIGVGDLLKGVATRRERKARQAATNGSGHP